MNTFDLDSFFPKEKLQLIKAEQTNDIIHIHFELLRFISSSKKLDVKCENT